MAALREKRAITEDEILASAKGKNTVNAALAAEAIGWSTPTLYAALQSGRVPFGLATQNQNTGTWTYAISPLGLIRYLRGDAAAIRLPELAALVEDSVDTVVNAKMKSVTGLIEAVKSVAAS